MLTQDVAEFLYREAELLDERRYEEWLALLADDIRYWMPMRRNVKFGESEREFTRDGTDIAWFDEGKDTLTRRVRQIQTGIHWAEEPQSRIAHLVSNVQVVEASPSVAERAGSRGQMPLSDLPQPGRDRDRPPGRQARGPAAPGRRRLANRAPHDHPRPERAAGEEPDVFLLKPERIREAFLDGD